jgi:protein gp37
MSDKTGIAWSDATWNPVTGCTKVSQGCKHCYAEREWARLTANPKATAYYGRAFTDVACHENRLDQPLRWSKPRMIFVNSMSDLFHEDVPESFIDRVFAIMGLNQVMRDTPHVFQILTKRPERMQAYMSDPDTVWRVTRAMKAHGPELPGENSPPAWPLPNVWLGVSIEDQATADERIPLLLQTPAAVRWVSAEPLLGPIDLEEVPVGMSGPLRQHGGAGTDTQKLDWIVVGGESGPNSRPMHAEWVRKLRDDSAAAGVPFFMKQLGYRYLDASQRVMGAGCRDSLRFPRDPVREDWSAEASGYGIYRITRLAHRAGADMAEWPTDLRVREWPTGIDNVAV